MFTKSYGNSSTKINIDCNQALFLEETGMEIERRKFQRHSLRFQLEVRGYSQHGKPFVETAQLINISGGGALFHPLQADQYFQGQVVETSIILPGTPAIKGQMRTRATVVRLIRNSSGQPVVSLHFLDSFTLSRDGENLNCESKTNRT
ncbi:MAG TPA: PilZ domain-containing protein [Desulfobulbus sp.]|nr:PilZ domain-containing protein [Desulfobulbus sp.]